MGQAVKPLPVSVSIGSPVSSSVFSPLRIHGQPPPPRELFAAPPVRDRGTGRPTKKERREIDRLMGRRS